MISYMTSKDVRGAGKSSGLYSWGCGICGQLGNGSESNSSRPVKIQGFEDKEIKKISSSKFATAILTCDGKLYTCGRSKMGLLGLSETVSNVSTFQQVTHLEGIHVTDIAVGQSHMIAVSDKGEVYSWGWGEHGKLGHIDEAEKCTDKRRMVTNSVLRGFNLPKRLEFFGNSQFPKAIAASCGKRHSLILTEDHKVYAFGYAGNGTLGIKDFEGECSVEPVLVPFEQDIVQIECGFDFSLALGADGRVYSWGLNDWGQLGHNQGIKQDTPQPITNRLLSKVTKISCGENFSAALTSEGKLYTWGYGDEGQLGHGMRKDVRAPKQVDFPEQIQKVSCGFAHVGFITATNSLQMFGRGREGQLGREESKNSSALYRLRPSDVEVFSNETIVEVKCGGDHTFAIVNSMKK